MSEDAMPGESTVSFPPPSFEFDPGIHARETLTGEFRIHVSPSAIRYKKKSLYRSNVPTTVVRDASTGSIVRNVLGVQFHSPALIDFDAARKHGAVSVLVSGQITVFESRIAVEENWNVYRFQDLDASGCFDTVEEA